MNNDDHNHNARSNKQQPDDYSKTDKQSTMRQRLWWWWWHRHGGQPQGMARTMFFMVLLLLMTVYAVSLLMIWIFQHAQCTSRELGVVWTEGPAHSMHRPCPHPPYETLLDHNHDNHNKKKKRPHICITTLTDHESPSLWQRLVQCRNFDAVQHLTWPNRLAYSQRHGYTLVDASFLLDHSRPPAWSKIRAVQALLTKQHDAASTISTTIQPHPRCDWVFWMDADTVIMNMTIPLESFLPVRDDIHLIATVDRRFGVNSGAWLIRNSDWSRDFLQQWWNLKNWVRPAGLSLSGDNAAFGHLVQERIQKEQQQETRSSGSSHHHPPARIQVPARCNFNSFAVFLPQQAAKTRLGRGSHDDDKESWLQQQEWYMSDQFYHAGDFVAHASGIDQKAAGVELLLLRAAQLQKGP